MKLTTFEVKVKLYCKGPINASGGRQVARTFIFFYFIQLFNKIVDLAERNLLAIFNSNSSVNSNGLALSKLSLNKLKVTVILRLKC